MYIRDLGGRPAVSSARLVTSARQHRRPPTAGHADQRVIAASGTSSPRSASLRLGHPAPDTPIQRAVVLGTAKHGNVLGCVDFE